MNKLASIKVLGKATAILEHIASCSPAPVLPGEVTAACGINQATTVRIMRDLMDIGLLRQVSRTQGYVLGALAYKLGQGCPLENRLVGVAWPVVDEVARVTCCSALLATRQDQTRYVLCDSNHSGNPICEVRGIGCSDFYASATGRVLLAYAGSEATTRILAQRGLPDERRWPEAAGEASFKTALESIRSDALSVKSDGIHLALACPVFADDAFAGAFGVVVAEVDRAEDTLSRLRDAVRGGAARITASLRSNQTVG